MNKHNIMNQRVEVRDNRFANKDTFKENYQEKYRETNRELIKYIYSTLDISQFKFEIVRCKEQYESKFITGTYFVAPNYFGKNCFLVFTKLKTKYYSFMVDRRQLSYTFDKVKLDEVFVIHCNVDVDLAIYDGTILDGVYIRKGNGNQCQHEFIITDIYAFKGTDYTNNKLNHKLFELEMYLDNINSQIRYINERINAKINLELKINKIHKLTDLKKFLETDFIEAEKSYQIRGVCFYPELSGIKMIWLNDSENTNTNINTNSTPNSNLSSILNANSNTGTTSTNSNISSNTIDSNDGKVGKKEKETKSSDNTDDGNGSDDSSPQNNLLQKSKNIVKRYFVSKTNDPIFAILEMQATKTADNYKLFALEQVKEGNKVRLRKCQMDIAYIPNMQKSQWCRDITTASPKGSVFVKCIWRDAKSKWEPMELKTDIKLPSLIDDIRKDIVEMEKSDSDSGDD